MKLKPYAGADNRKWSFSLLWNENREQYCYTHCRINIYCNYVLVKVIS